MTARSRWRACLPHFDVPSFVFAEQRRTANALRYLGLEDLPMRDCNSVAPCRSGLCARCIRDLRMTLLDFLAAEHLDRLSWHFVTIRVEGWKVAPGDVRPFGRLRDHLHIQRLKKALERLHIRNLIIFGSIETVYVTVANAPVPKPFHLHLMISGATPAQISEAVRRTIPLDRHDVQPLDIRPVLDAETDFFKAASYAFKNPLVTKSKASPDHRGSRRIPTAAQRRELIQNLKVHGWTGRLILVGLRCDNGRFRRTAKLSATATGANSARLRQLPPRPHRQAPRGPGSQVRL